MIVDVQSLSKAYGSVQAVHELSFRVSPGHITGFLGPNGSGKSTTMRLMLGLDHGTGTTLYEGKRLVDHRPVTKVVGSHLDAKFFHPKRTARAHLQMMGSEAGVSRVRVDEVLELVGLQGVADKRPGGFSLGMGQRLGLATAILAEPQVLLLDEPANGLDPQSIQWLRDFLTHYAQRGNSVLVSSHLLSEMQLMADHLVVIARGRLIADESMSQFVSRSTKNDVLVRSSDAVRLAAELRAQGLGVAAETPEALAVTGAGTDRIGDIAFAAGITVRELVNRQASLEDAFLELTSESQDFAAGSDPGAMPADGGAR